MATSSKPSPGQGAPDEVPWLTPAEKEAWTGLVSLVLLLPGRWSLRCRASRGLTLFELSIGGREDPVRLRFTADPGPAVVAGLSDLGDRFRLTVNEVDVVDPDEELPNLPVACAVWEPRPSLSTSAEAWLLAGAPHRAVEGDRRRGARDFADMTGTEMVTIDADTTPRSFQRELRWNAAYHRLAQGL